MYLLDTNHCSRLLDGHPGVTRTLTEKRWAPVSTSVIVRGELSYMVQCSRRREENAIKVSAFLKSILIHPVENETAEIYGTLKERIMTCFGPRSLGARRRISLERLGFAENDLWIAATALLHGFILVTSDTDFTRMNQAMPDLRIESWMSGSNV